MISCFEGGKETSARSGVRLALGAVLIRSASQDPRRAADEVLESILVQLGPDFQVDYKRL